MVAVIREIRAWLIVSWILLQYLFYRLGFRSCPTFMNNRPECKLVIGRVLGWPKRLRISGAEFCPKAHPAIFCCNHFKKDDPFEVEACIYDASDHKIWIIPMMRDDFFKSHHKTVLFDPDELVNMFGTMRISREKVSLSQLKPFVELLRSGGSFLIFPGRTRSQSGLIFEYREGVEEPGGPAFFAAQAQRSRPDLRVAIVPVARSYNPATRRSTVSFGKPLYLEGVGDRAAQRALDFQLIEEIGRIFEISVSHILAAILYLHRLHALSTTLTIDFLRNTAQYVVKTIQSERRIAPEAFSELPREVFSTLKYFAKHKLVTVQRDSIIPHDEAILRVPTWDRSYRDVNPLKFLCNQVAHMPDLVRAIEEKLL